MPTSTDYTIAVVCALPVEFAAFCEMMDEEFDHLPHQPTDSNLYCFGRIGGHKVVAACPSVGQKGTDFTATIAVQMRRNFTSLCLGILVGIGGGVPSLENDIRLGDVVISQPTRQHGGLVQYDFGRAGAEERFMGSSLSKPPSVLLRALAKLQSNNLRGKTRIAEYLSTIANLPTFRPPGPGQDILFSVSSQHVSGPTCDQCHPKEQRGFRATESPSLFFGTIASGNQDVSDGLTRDKYSQELGGVLCFEMEAAGILNGFPCLVIRGICDYADSHKNKCWQPYAAAAAAAYAKELLCTITPEISTNSYNSDYPSKPHFMVPFGRNNDFVGRKLILRQLLKTIPSDTNQVNSQRTIIYGLGGTGKTQLALECVYQVRDHHPHCSIFWVSARDVNSFENVYREIGEALKVQGLNNEKADVKSLVKAALSHERTGQWLLIVDDADDPDLMFAGPTLFDSLPFSRKGSILLTTRSHEVTMKLTTSGYVINLEDLSDIEAMKLLLTNLETNQTQDNESTTRLLEFLAYSPLAIAQASAYMAKTRISTATYFNYCQSSDKSMVRLLSKGLEAQNRYGAIHNPVTTTWLISFHHISKDTPLAARLLNFSCFLAERDIPESLLLLGEDELEVARAVCTLKEYAFIVERMNSNSFDIHTLIRLAMRNWVEEHGEKEKWITETIRRLSHEFPFPTYENWRVWSRYLPHAQIAIEYRDECIDMSAQWSLLFNVGESNALLGNYNKAELLYRQIIEMTSKVLGHEHHSLRASTNNLANIFASQGRYLEAEQMYQHMVELTEKVLGREHPSTITSIDSLANVSISQGTSLTAERLCQQVLELTEKVLGGNRPSLITSINTLAVILSNKEKYVEAEQEEWKVLEEYTMILSQGHSYVLNSMNNLAKVFQMQGKYEDAEHIYRQVLRLREKHLGQKHPETLASMNSLALILDSQGKFSEAEQIHRQILEQEVEVFGREHPSTLDNMNNLASVLQIQKKYSEAEQLHWETLKIREKVLGREHPSTLANMNNLAEVYRHQARYMEAQDMHWQTLVLREKVLGRDHPSTIKSRNNFQACLETAKKSKSSNASAWVYETKKLFIRKRKHGLTLD